MRTDILEIAKHRGPFIAGMAVAAGILAGGFGFRHASAMRGMLGEAKTVQYAVQMAGAEYAGFGQRFTQNMSEQDFPEGFMEEVKENSKYTGRISEVEWDQDSPVLRHMTYQTKHYHIEYSFADNRENWKIKRT